MNGADRRELLDHTGADGEERLALARALDRWEQSRQRNSPAWTDFLTPRQQSMAKDLLRAAGAAETSFFAAGGWDGAERRILFFLPEWMAAESGAGSLAEPEAEFSGAESPLRYLRAEFSPGSRPGHRDLLGSLTGLGIVREKIGDILVTEESADIIVLESVREFLMQNWTQAGRAKLQVREIERGHLHFPQARKKEIRDTLSSLRLDALCAAGFRMSRGKAAGLIASGKVQRNWRDCTRPDQTVAPGDTVSARGLGKFRLAEAGVLTRKGRIPVLIERYL